MENIPLEDIEVIEETISASEFIEKKLVDTNTHKPIVLQQWQKDVIEKVCHNEDINKVWILTGRKSGATTLCKWLHWLRPEAKVSYVFSHNLMYAKSIAKMPITIKKGFDKDEIFDELGVKWACPMTITNFVRQIEINDDMYHFMYDTGNFNKLTYNTLMSFNPKLFTICLPYKEFGKVMDLLEEDKEKDNVVIVADGDLTLYPEWLETSGLKELYSSTKKIYKI